MEELLDAWREDAASPPPTLSFQASPLHRSHPGWPGGECRADASLAAVRSECWEALQQQKLAAEATGCFVFSHRRLDGLTALSLAQYLRDECRARFVDLSSLGDWDKTSLAVAGALRHGLRQVRTLAVSGNLLGAGAGADDVLAAWCEAIREHPGLQHVALCDTGLDDRHAGRLADMLRAHSVLFAVDLSHNRISDAGATAIQEALTENRVILEVCLEGNDTTEVAHAGLAAVLRRNADAVGGCDGATRRLATLRRARAEAATAVSKFGAAAAPGTAAPSGAARPGAPLSVARGTTFFPAPEPGGGGGCDAAGFVFFDADMNDLDEELSKRCEAGWRYSAADREALCGLRERIRGLKAHRRLERDRGQEICERISDAQVCFRERVAPREEAIYRMREGLAVEVDATRRLLQETVGQRVALQAAEEELEAARRERGHAEVGAAKLQHSLKLRHEEVATETQSLEQQIFTMEESIVQLAADNMRCRKLLHAARFETDNERFAPPWTGTGELAA